MRWSVRDPELIRHAEARSPCASSNVALSRVTPYPPHPRGVTEGTTHMLGWILLFLLLALVAAGLGFGGIAGAAAGIAQILFLVFLVMLAISVIASLTTGRRLP